VQVVYLGEKPSSSDGLAFTSDGRLIYGSLSTTAVVAWDVSKPLSTQSVLWQDGVTLQWADTFAFGSDNSLYFTTNKLQRYFAVRGARACGVLRCYSISVCVV
jgi:hypothetical protein